MELKNDLVYIDSLTNEKVIFNMKTWLLIIKGIIMQYAGKTEKEAQKIINESAVIIPTTYDQVVYYSHETEYHWAMLFTYGKGYWLKNISSIEPEGYDDWENQYRIDNKLVKPSFQFE